jgi:hypothetical protein
LECPVGMKKVDMEKAQDIKVREEKAWKAL